MFARWMGYRCVQEPPTKKEVSMHAVVVRVRIDPARAEEAEADVRDRVAPAVKQVPGATAGYWARSEDGTNGTSMVVFESEETARAAADTVPDRLPESVTLESVEVREV